MDKTELIGIDRMGLSFTERVFHSALVQIADKVFPDEEPDIRKTWAASAGEELGRAPYCSVRTCSNFAITTIKYDDFRCIDLCLDCAESLKAVAKEGAKTATVDEGAVKAEAIRGGWSKEVLCVACGDFCKHGERWAFYDMDEPRSFPICNTCRMAMIKGAEW
ncbi:MAG: hypothetical protein ABIJ57_08690 [Pseudomonadota bacterium]